ncbi:tetraacyldisaccharide 4'-kinase [unidentified eubacterium SCB49]|nr:tetraacyldisaccharide 4'-kinase [unidentified eubacterium SCB49]
MQILRAILFPFAIIYDMVTRARNFFYDKGYFKSVSYPIPVICVGNLSVGGTGKSPMIAYLVELLSPIHTIAVLSRGYGRETKGYIEVGVDATSQEVGDEPLQLKKNFPEICVVVCEDRRTALETLKNKVSIVLMDDGFQHRKVKPAFTILLTAFDSLYFKDFLLPTGNLRESKIGADRANLVVVTKCPESMPAEKIKQIEQGLGLKTTQEVYFTTIGYELELKNVSEILPIDYLNNRDFTLVTGIAKPAPLVQFLKDRGLTFNHKRFEDHHEFSANEILDLKQDALIVTTEKDFVRLHPKLEGGKLYYLPIKTKFMKDTSTIFEGRIQSFITDFKKG